MNTNLPGPETYDYVVVGGGAAGCVVAARLSESADRTVLLLEAGGPDTDPDILAPRGVGHLLRGEYDWCDMTVPQPELQHREVPVSAGRTLGGGGAINFLAWFRGHRLDYDNWAAQGMEGWGWDDVLPRFLRSEDSELGTSDVHSTGGPIAVTTAASMNPISLAFMAAGVENGLPLNRDFNGAELDGVGLFLANMRDGQRNSAAHGYLHSIRDRPNLTVHTNALVQRVALKDGVARGVVFTDVTGEQIIVNADSVVLCAGALRTPQLLMLSGIGPADHLRELGIDVVHDLPGVGANLQDHPAAMVRWPLIHGKTWIEDFTPENVDRYIATRSGPLASPFGEVAAFLRCGDNAPAPDLQIFPLVMDFAGSADPVFTCLVVLLKPESRGTLRLRSTDPWAKPLIDPQYLAEQADRDLLVKGLRRITEIGSAPALRAYLGEAEVSVTDTDNVLLQSVRDNLISINHPAGTCRAGTDKNAVVDPMLRVRGIDGLHVIDASIMPDLPRGNTHAPSIMIGERGADLLLAGAR
ncbi:GMC family oxidoreductase [Mycobacterium montefiorense]|uniref:Choline dehydrogenase n=1 Tax=Mycobacterium montefiorense TaxID=154654 RepID=A0AA37PQC6_9MYCO|nr:GMC family oxidoreductase N-terminal domain-containing protein [Mycobacterium montefiorense]GBG36336.1 choline dehydrogenase [Mycobacterium montefiorense]GKU32895.1 choline dehydrogenase [Mycobacterium montefiorense]GKU38635.1 choline dehydrogenase [Mycobacterium montefiorense]GKU46598.1 choline dehydrogenase [Mycobacterium montefiorense]GKU51629.1 choline dehydrogenase [Mycobacterium montefiorense]